MKQIRYLAVFTCFALLASGWSSSTRAQEPSAKVSVFASGLVNPRGLKFGPDGNLYVAEGGTPTPPTIEAAAGVGGDCSAGANGPGNYFGSTTGSRISRIDADGNVTTFVDNLPSSEAGGLASGVADWKHDVRGCRMFARRAQHSEPGRPHKPRSHSPDQNCRSRSFSAGSSGGKPHRS